MTKKTFKIRAKFAFDGVFSVKAHNRQEAEKIIKNDCAALIGAVEIGNRNIIENDVKHRAEAVIKRHEEEE